MTIACISVGAFIMLLAVLKTAKLRGIVAGPSVNKWIWLGRFMVLFLVGYLVSIALIILNYNEPLLLIIGLVFLLGAYFVYLVVFNAKADMQKIHDASVLLSKKNEELKKINQELDQFAYRTSHDLKAPVTSLKGLIHIASLSDSPGEIERIHKMMKDRLTSLEHLIRDILDLSKNSRTNLESSIVCIYDVIYTLIQNHGHADHDRISVTIDGDKELKTKLDKTRFKMVVTNLVSNAKQYADLKKPEPFVKVKYWKENTNLFVCVSDNGKGISKEYHDKIFDMFFRLDATSQGSGLGLYIVRETIEKMGGTIDLISEQGVGSEFVVSFPVGEEELN